MSTVPLYFLVETIQGKMTKHRFILSATSREQLEAAVRTSGGRLTDIVSAVTNCHAFSNEFEILQQLDTLDTQYTHITWKDWNNNDLFNCLYLIDLIEIVVIYTLTFFVLLYYFLLVFHYHDIYYVRSVQ
jgi:hypothetical protein